MTLRLGSIAPNFKAKTTKGDIDFHKYIEGSWAILFSHPADFSKCHLSFFTFLFFSKNNTLNLTFVSSLSCSTKKTAPVCTTELGEVARRSSDFASRGVKVIGLSANELTDHEKWVEDINEVNNVNVDFPIIADGDRTVAKLYDMLDNLDATNVDTKGIPFTVRNVFVIDPKKVIR